MSHLTSPSAPRYFVIRTIDRTKREVEQRIFTRMRSLMLRLFEEMLQNRQHTVNHANLEALQNDMNDLVSATPGSVRLDSETHNGLYAEG